MIVAGFGFTTRATALSLTQALSATGCNADIDRIAVPHDKAAHPAILDFAQAQGWDIAAIQPQPLEAARTETQSFLSRLMRRTGSVAEASALAGAGLGAELIATRHISDDRMATCAIAQGPDT
ncbi:cobalamin biosynthesis protein [uncultured Tateyamaria sp.]|uniref:cobalamin biosynthesis protein n=1 Tax=uncultured Tateyamaria sp. TaxID=455651 RepID=UPI002612CF81|nr:cobalamin biosynthesis protein [uncultured Tateyamaria sp.]